MDSKLAAIDGVTIDRDHWDVPLRVKLRAYLRFNRRIDVQLRRLVVRWAHVASPYARGVPVEAWRTERPVPPME